MLLYAWVFWEDDWVSWLRVFWEIFELDIKELWDELEAEEIGTYLGDDGVWGDGFKESWLIV